MDALRAEYLEIENGFRWPEEREDMPAHDQLHQLFTDIVTKLRERSIAENLESSLYAGRLDTLLDFLNNLFYCLNGVFPSEKSERKYHRTIWFHKPNDFIRFIKKNGDPEIDKASLLEIAATYLANPWLQHDQIDWVFIDVLIFCEASAYSQSIMSGSALGKVNWIWAWSDGDIEKYGLFHLGKGLGMFALRYIIPPVIVFILFYLNRESTALKTGIAYAIYLVLHASLWVFRYPARKLQRQTLEEHSSRLEKMLNAYYYCKPPIINLGTLRTYLNKAVEAGAIFDGALFSILKRVEESRGEAFMPFAT